MTVTWLEHQPPLIGMRKKWAPVMDHVLQRTSKNLGLSAIAPAPAQFSERSPRRHFQVDCPVLFKHFFRLGAVGWSASSLYSADTSSSDGGVTKMSADTASWSSLIITTTSFNVYL